MSLLTQILKLLMGAPASAEKLDERALEMRHVEIDQYGQQKVYHRTKFLINPRFQISFLLMTVGTAVAVVATFYCALLVFFRRFEDIGRQLGLPASHEFFQFIHQQQSDMNMIFAVTAVVVFFGLCVAGLVMSHRVAGPLYRLCKHMNEVADGHTLANVRFRKKDYFPEVADAFNRHIEKVRNARQQGADGGKVA